VRRKLLQQERVPAVVSAALGVALASLGGACSEEQYNPAIGAAGSATVAAAGAAGQSGSGTSNSGGSAGAAGGAAGAGGAGESTATKVYAFQSSLEGFFINYYCTGPAVNTNCVQLQAQQPAEVADAGADAGEDAGAAAEQPVISDFFTLEQDPSLGSPAPGSAKLTLRFTSGAQSANFAINFGSGTEPGIDLAGKTLQAQVRVEAGAPATTYAKMYIKTGATYYYADSGQRTLLADAWTPISFAGFGAPSYPSAPDPALYTLGDVREIGMELGATDIASAVAATIHIDSVSY
jgi:hypothetical protein